MYVLKFLVFQKPLPLPPPTPEQSKMMAEALEASVKIFQDLKRHGKCECYYGVSGIPSGFAILDVDSHDELNEIISTAPITAYGQIEIYPLMTLESAVKTMKKMIAQLSR